MRIALALIALTLPLAAQEPSHTYWATVGAFAGGAAFDIASSVYLNRYVKRGTVRETNGLLANPDGTYNTARGIGVNSAAIAGTVGIERLAIRYVRRKRGEASAARVERAFGWVNIGFGASYAAVGVHNLTLRR